MPRRIRWRIAIPYLVLMVLSTSVLTIILANQCRQQEEDRWQEQLLVFARILAAEKDETFFTGETDLLKPDVIMDPAVRITLLDPEGVVLESSLSRPPEDARKLPGVSQALMRGEGSERVDDIIGAAVTVRDPENRALGIVQIQRPVPGVRPIILQRFFWPAAAAVLISSAGVVVLALIVDDVSRKPVESLTIAAQQMSMGNFTNLAFPQNPQDLENLSQALQVMADQLGGQINALTSERAKLSAVLNQMTDGVMIVDADGRVQLINPAAERLFQIRESEGLGRSIVEVLRHHQLVDLWRSAKDGQRESMTLEIGPQHLFLQVVASPLKAALPGSIMILIQDLTQLRRLETVRRDFISNVSHELRSPLASMKALAETLQEGALDDPPAARRFVVRMETEIDNLTQLVNELLELSRIESGKVPLSFQRINPCDLIEPAVERMLLQVERAGLELTLACEPALPVVFADQDRITQVLINMIHNAVKFTPPGGRITVSAYEDGDHIVFYVRDTGVGIARKDLGRIFERFYKADRARAGGGTGLGLSIARHMIESHGGYIWAESEEQVGSTFYFSLPIA